MRKSIFRVLPSIFALFMASLLIAVPGCDYGRMYDQEDIKTYEKKMPAMDKRTIPIKEGFEVLASADAKSLGNPLSYSNESVEQGRQVYGYFCAQCHGKRLDGNGPVGQSFAPLPADLTLPVIQSQTDGVLYSRVRLGFRRHPKLFSTISAEEGWAVVVYMRSMRRQ